MKKKVILEMAIIHVEKKINGKKLTTPNRVAMRVVHPDDFDLENGNVSVTATKKAVNRITDFLEDPEKYNDRIVLKAKVWRDSNGDLRLHFQSVIKNLVFAGETDEWSLYRMATHST